MTIEQLQWIVIKLSNQEMVRWYAWLNYPNDPQLMGIELLRRTSDMLAIELSSKGFVLNDTTGIWTIVRTPEPPPAPKTVDFAGAARCAVHVAG